MSRLQQSTAKRASTLRFYEPRIRQLDSTAAETSEVATSISPEPTRYEPPPKLAPRAVAPAHPASFRSAEQLDEQRLATQAGLQPGSTLTLPVDLPRLEFQAETTNTVASAEVTAAVVRRHAFDEVQLSHLDTHLASTSAPASTLTADTEDTACKSTAPRVPTTDAREALWTPTLRLVLSDDELAQIGTERKE